MSTMGCVKPKGGSNLVAAKMAKKKAKEDKQLA
jgi:hypothetical protein